jgi:hypothetical protein
MLSGVYLGKANFPVEEINLDGHAEIWCRWEKFNRRLVTLLLRVLRIH